MNVKRHYTPIQIGLDLFSLFLLYVFFYSQIRGFISTVLYFNTSIKADGAEKLQANPYPIIIWAGIALVVCVITFIAPFVFAKKTKLTQKQYDLWVNAVLLIRAAALVVLMNLMAEHMHVICPSLVKSNPLSVLIGVVLIIIIVRITKHRIKLLTPEKKRRRITED